jgi:hypothetical protein
MAALQSELRHEERSWTDGCEVLTMCCHGTKHKAESSMDED